MRKAHLHSGAHPHFPSTGEGTGYLVTDLRQALTEGAGF